MLLIRLLKLPLYDLEVTANSNMPQTHDMIVLVNGQHEISVRVLARTDWLGKARAGFGRVVEGVACFGSYLWDMGSHKQKVLP